MPLPSADLEKLQRVDHTRLLRIPLFILIHITSVALILTLLAQGIAWWMWLPLHLAAAASLHGISLFTHEGVHGALSSNPLVNRLLAAVCAWPVLQNFAGYKVLHLRHHANLGGPGDPDHYPNYASWPLAVWLMPLQALQRIQLEMARGMQRIGLAYAPSLIGLPLLLMLGCGGWFHTQQRLLAEMAIALTMLALGLVLSVQFWLFLRGFRGKLQAVAAVYTLRPWLAVALPLLLIDGSFVVLRQTDTLMIGMMVGTSSVGIYAAALETSAWVNFVLLAVNSIAAPMFAALYVEGDRANLQRLAATVARWMFPLALVVSVGLMVFADPILGLFGAEFGAAKPAMLWLIGGQLVNVGAGSVGYLLTMTGHQNQCAIAVGCSAVLNFGLNLVLIPQFGLVGAAIATAICMSVWNLWLHVLVVKHLGIRPSIWAAVLGGDRH